MELLRQSYRHTIIIMCHFFVGRTWSCTREEFTLSHGDDIRCKLPAPEKKSRELVEQRSIDIMDRIDSLF
jgi:hypothetical protein